jgi:hypothetical protein
MFLIIARGEVSVHKYLKIYKSFYINTLGDVNFDGRMPILLGRLSGRHSDPSLFDDVGPGPHEVSGRSGAGVQSLSCHGRPLAEGEAGDRLHGMRGM